MCLAIDQITCLACFHFPQKHRKRIRTTNLLERLNREIKRRADVVQIFPNQEACERLIGALCVATILQNFLALAFHFIYPQYILSQHPLNLRVA
ncbi:hypothetical protein F4Y93_04925 [Candidatus Poribacteria bacterium]|nr:hypothetical protein [Candidatus Poribacteria bacterium]